MMLLKSVNLTAGVHQHGLAV